MNPFRRRSAAAPPPDPAAVAAALAAETAALIERERALGALRREQEAADREDARRAEQEAAEDKKRHEQEAAERRKQRIARLNAIGVAARTVGPLLLSNVSSIGGQIGYVYQEAPADWHPVVKTAVAVGVALAAESISLYIAWQAHEALLRKAYSTAAKLRRASYGVALLFGAVNYSHFSNGWKPTALAVILATFSISSPWLWGLYSRWKEHILLVAEGLVDEAGVEFSPARRKAFPIRSWAAKRWSIEHNVRDPKVAWEGYNKERGRRRAQAPQGGRIRVAATVLRRGAAALPADASAGQMDDETRAALDQIQQQARDARYRLAMGANAFYRAPAGILATPAPRKVAIEQAPRLAIASTPAGHPNGHDSGQKPGHQSGHTDGQDDADLLAIVAATQDAPMVASDVAKPTANDGQESGQHDGQESGHPDGQTDGQPRRRVVSAVAKPPARKVATAVAKPTDDETKKRDTRIKRLAGKPGMTDQEIATQVGVSISTVRRVLGKKK